MNDKYYTPEIEEFHVGFCYETRTHTLNDWGEVVFENLGHDLHEWLDQDIESGDVRVKYLDREDIEELGWENTDYSEKAFTMETRAKQNSDIVITWSITKIFSQYRIEQSANLLPIKNLPCFIGTIKNKSELKRLMKQLGI